MECFGGCFLSDAVRGEKSRLLGRWCFFNATKLRKTVGQGKTGHDCWRRFCRFGTSADRVVRGRGSPGVRVQGFERASPLLLGVCLGRVKDKLKTCFECMETFLQRFHGVGELVTFHFRVEEFRLQKRETFGSRKVLRVAERFVGRGRRGASVE